MGNQLSNSERCAFRIFWKWFKDKDLTDIELDKMVSEKDPPDFHFFDGTEHIAMEHTQVFRGHDQAASAPDPSLLPLHDQKIQHRICDHLNKLLQAGSGEMPCVDISITFTSCANVKGPEQENTVARDVFALVRENLEVGVSFPIEFCMTDLQPISSCLADMLVTDGRDIMDGTESSSVSRQSIASCHSVGQVDEWGLNYFAAAAAKKGKALTRYDAKFDQYWLLSSAGGLHRTQWIEPPPKACSTGIRCQFNRVFFVDESRQRVYEIHAATSDNMHH